MRIANALTTEDKPNPHGVSAKPIHEKQREDRPQKQ